MKYETSYSRFVQDANFWLPSERSQLLRALLDQVPSPGEFLAAQLANLQEQRGNDFAFTSSLLASLRIAGLLAEVLPLDDGTTDRMTIWNGGRFCRLWPMAPVTTIQEYFGKNLKLSALPADTPKVSKTMHSKS